MATTDTKLLEARLITRDSAIGGSSVSRCAARMQQYFNLLDANNDFDAISRALENYIRDIILYKLEMDKVNQIYQMCDREIEEYLMLEKDIEENILHTEASIEQLSVELMQQKQLRCHREECENLARVVISIPSCATTEKEITQLTEECDHLQALIATKESQEATRITQFRLIMQAISDLQRSINEEDSMQDLLQQMQTADDDEDDDNDDVDEDGGSRDKRITRGEQEQPASKKMRTDGDDDGSAAGATGVEEEGEGANATKHTITAGFVSQVQDGDGKQTSPRAPPPPPPPPPPPSRPPTVQAPSPSALKMHQQIKMISSAQPEEGEEDEANGDGMDTSK